MPKPKPPTLAGDLLNRRVYIEWADPDADWHHYRLEAIDGAWLRLQGLPQPDGSEYGSGPMWVPASAVALLEREP